MDTTSQSGTSSSSTSSATSSESSQSSISPHGKKTSTSSPHAPTRDNSGSPQLQSGVSGVFPKHALKAKIEDIISQSTHVRDSFAPHRMEEANVINMANQLRPSEQPAVPSVLHRTITGGESLERWGVAGEDIGRTQYASLLAHKTAMHRQAHCVSQKKRLLVRMASLVNGLLCMAGTGLTIESIEVVRQTCDLMRKLAGSEVDTRSGTWDRYVAAGARMAHQLAQKSALVTDALHHIYDDERKREILELRRLKHAVGECEGQKAMLQLGVPANIGSRRMGRNDVEFDEVFASVALVMKHMHAQVVAQESVG